MRPRGLRSRTIPLAVLGALLAPGPSAAISAPPAARTASSTATVTVAEAPLGRWMRRGAVGLSVEANALAEGRLDPAFGNLAAFLRLLGPATLRVGANGADRTFWTSSGEPAPPWSEGTITPERMRGLGELARATGWNVVLGVNLKRFDPARAADEVASAVEHLGPALAAVEIGNEPELFRGWTFERYMREQLAYRSAILARTPGVRFAGPVAARTTWLADYGRATGRSDAHLTLHHYPLRTCKVKRATIPQLLGPARMAREEALLAELSRAARISGRPGRIGETNSASCNGVASVSPRFAAALWTLDWALRAVRGGAAGIDFHSLLGLCSRATYSPLCAEDQAAANAGILFARPSFYGMLAARRLEGGRFAPAQVRGRPELLAYATRTRDDRVRIALVDLGLSGGVTRVRVRLPLPYAARVERLRAPSLRAGPGTVRFGGAQATSQAALAARAARVAGSGGTTLRVDLRAGSAAVLSLSPGARAARRTRCGASAGTCRRAAP